MKAFLKILIGVAFLATLIVIFTCCSKKDQEAKPQKGKLKLNIGISVQEYKALSELKSTTDDFSVKVLNASNESVVSFDHAAEIPDSLELPEGNYCAVASSVNDEVVAFENPYYRGNSGTFTITAGQTSAVTIPCSLDNIKVTVVYSDRVKNSFVNFTTTVRNASDSLVFEKDETRKGFFDEGPFYIKSRLYSAGKTAPSKIITGEIADPQPGKLYEIHVDALPTEGNAAIGIALNNIVETEVVNISDSDAGGNGVPGYGDLLITEIMYNPLALSDSEGEWIELFNNSKGTINLKGLVVRRGASSSFHRIATDVNLAPGAYVVLGKAHVADTTVQYVYGSSISLTNSGDELIVNNYGTNGTDGTIICSVNYGVTGFLTNLNGKSLQLDPSVKDVNAAKLGTNWCAASVAYSTGDLGTPGLVNSSCH